MKKPIIGITVDSAKDNEKYKYAPKPWYALRQCYSNNITNFGGIPFLIPYHDDVTEVINHIDGLLIPGGDEDINPKFYGQSIEHERVKTNDIRASFELSLFAAAEKQNIPTLGICNGMQVINTYFGGTLHQHLPDAIKSNINHEQTPPKHVPSHSIQIENDTILAKCNTQLEFRKDFNHKDVVMVNSTHHQAIDKLGKGLIVSARAPDGVIEAIESINHKFIVGVEWHPEHLNSELDINLFKMLVDMSKK